MSPGQVIRTQQHTPPTRWEGWVDDNVSFGTTFNEPTNLWLKSVLNMGPSISSFRGRLSDVLLFFIWVNESIGYYYSYYYSWTFFIYT